jgi:hypothetical protein
MQQAVGSLRAELVEEKGCCVVLLHPDRPREQLILHAVESRQSWLASAGVAAATVSFDGRRHRIRQ